jgi:hypothetical protein
MPNPRTQVQNRTAQDGEMEEMTDTKDGPDNIKEDLTK